MVKRWLLVGMVGMVGTALGFAPVTAAHAEGSAAGVISSDHAKGWALKPAKKSWMSRAAGRAIAAGPLVDGLRAESPMPSEPYLPQAGCYPKELPGVAAFRDMLLETFPRSAVSLQSYNVVRGCNTPGISEHEEGRALDFEAHVSSREQNAQARRLLRWLTKRDGYQARRFGILYIIFDQHIWGQYNQRWRLMADRGSITDNHQDHIHFTFTWNGALKRTAYWTGRAPGVHYGPCPVYQWHYAPVLVKWLTRTPRTSPCGSPRRIPRSWRYGDPIMYWQYGPRVRWLQQLLTEEGVYSGLVTGAFGPITYQAVRRWQAAHGVPRTGVWDAATQNASKRTVGKRVNSRIYFWDATRVTAPVGTTRTMSVNVHTGHSRQVREYRIIRRQTAGEWSLVSTGSTAADGTATIQLPVLAGDWAYRMVVPGTGLARPTRTFSKAVVGIG